MTPQELKEKRATGCLRFGCAVVVLVPLGFFAWFWLDDIIHYDRSYAPDKGEIYRVFAPLYWSNSPAMTAVWEATNRNPALKVGKTLPLFRLDKFYKPRPDRDIFFALPPELRPNSADEVETFLLVGPLLKSKAKGAYSGGVSAEVESQEIRAVDRKSATVIFSRVFEAGLPSQVIVGGPMTRSVGPFRLSSFAVRDGAIQELRQRSGYPPAFPDRVTARRVRGVAFSRSGTQLAAAATGLVRVWDAASGKELWRFTSAMHQPTSVAFSPDARSVWFGTEAGAVVQWKLASGGLVREHQLDGGVPVNCLFPFEDQLRLLVVKDGGSATLLNWQSPSATPEATPFLQTQNTRGSWRLRPTRMVPNETNLVFASGTDHRVFFMRFYQRPVDPFGDRSRLRWDLTTRREFGSELNLARITDLAVSTDGDTALVGAMDGRVRLYSMSPASVSSPGWVDPSGLQPVSAVALSMEDRLAFVAIGSVVLRYSLEEKRRGDRVISIAFNGPTLLSGHTGLITELALSPDGSRLASAAQDGTVRVWDTASDQTLFTLKAD